MLLTRTCRAAAARPGDCTYFAPQVPIREPGVAAHLTGPSLINAPSHLPSQAALSTTEMAFVAWRRVGRQKGRLGREMKGWSEERTEGRGQVMVDTLISFNESPRLVLGSREISAHH